MTRLPKAQALVVSLTLLLLTAAGRPAPAERTASLRLSPNVGPPTLSTTATGQGFGASETVDLTFDAIPVGSTTTSSSGSFSTRFSVPATATPGNHTATATGSSSGLTAQATFLVRTNWPRFHFDDANSGFNPFENVLSPANVGELVQKWAVPTAPGAAPSPVVSGGLVFVAPADGIVRALDPATGHTVWAVDTGGAMNGFAPTVAGNAVYVGNLSGEVFAIAAATGRVLWNESLGDGAIANTLLVAHGFVYASVYVDSGVTNDVLDARTGAILFTLNFLLVGSPATAAGVVYTTYGFGAQIVAETGLTGAVLWDTSFGGEIVDADAPAVADAQVYAGVEGHLFALDAQTGGVVWKKAVTNVDSGPAVANGVVYFDPSENLSAYDEATGARLWKQSTPGDSGSSAAVANGVAYVGTARGQLQAFDASDGTPLWTSLLAGAAFGGSPAVSDGVVYGSADDGTVYAFGLP
jgi:outer membrane protein assembly factor BamB